MRRGENWSTPVKNLSEQRKEPTTNSTHILHQVQELIPSHIGGRRLLSSLCQPCSKLFCRLPNFGLEVCKIETKLCYFGCFQFAACRINSVGVSNSSIIYDQRFSASSSRSSSRASYGRLKGASAWIPSSNNNNNDYLQIDLGSVYVVCAVATQGNPSADDWTETYKIETSLDNGNWQWYQENNAVKVCTVRVVCS